MMHLILSGSQAVAHNGGICLRQIVSIAIKYCVFERCSYGSDEIEAGATFIACECSENAEMRKWAFIDNIRHRTSTIVVTSGRTLKGVECCFSGRKAHEINPSNVEVIDCTFSWQCQTVMQLSEKG
jgi:hypothetical protein